MNEYLNPDSLFEAQRFGFSQVVRAGNGMIFISGQTAWNAQCQLDGATDFDAQLGAALTNLKRALTSVGATPKHVVRIRVYVANFSSECLAPVGAAMTDFFGPKHLPASTLVGVAALAAPELRVEIEADVQV